MSSPPSSPLTSTICYLRRTPTPSLALFPLHPFPPNHFHNPRYTLAIHDAHSAADENEWESEALSSTEHSAVIDSHDARWSSDDDENEEMSEVDFVRTDGRPEEEGGYESGWERPSDAEGREDLEAEHSDEDEGDDEASSAPLLYTDEEDNEEEVALVGVSWVQQRVRAAEERRWARRVARM